MSTPESQSVVFRPRARIVPLFGEQNISDQATGLIELVKNAYDADATRVEIELLGLASPVTTTITIRDNGFGMIREDVEQRWLSPATDYKERQKKASQRTPLGRLPIGEKGVGRFATQQLGHKLQMISRSAHSPEVVVQVNWDDFDKAGAYLDEIPILLYEREPVLFTRDATGTFLLIEQARSTWTEPLIAKIQRALRRLQSPHQGQNAIDFQIVLRCPDYPAYQDVSSSDILTHAHYTFEGAVTKAGLLDYEYACHHPAVPERFVAVDNYDLMPAARAEMFTVGKNKAGPFYLNFYVWDRSLEYLHQSSVSRADLDAMAGVSIFRDRLRVLPYGEPGNDWLDLDKERINAPSERIGNQQIIGFVEVFQEETPELRDKTNREGLIDNAAFRDIRALVRAAINVFTSQWLLDRQKLEKRTRPSGREPARESLQKARTLAEKVTETASDDIVINIKEPALLPPASPSDQQATSIPVKAEPSAPVAAYRNPLNEKPRDQTASPTVNLQVTQRQAMHHILDYLQKAVNYQQQNETDTEHQTQILLHLAATGMAAERVAHEFGRQVSAALTALRILHTLDKTASIEVADALGTLGACLGTLRNEFRVLAPYEAGWHLQRTARVSAEEALHLALKLNEHLISSYNIIVDVEGDDFDITARPASLVQVIDNLIHNACVWLASWDRVRHITINLDKVGRTITIADTGPGVPTHMREAIFKPFMSLRNGGRGLGLYIVQELLKPMQATIHLDEGRSQGAQFSLHFPVSNKE
jgi:C4-dicarboxylate-specific signal transduction histidine kinase